MRKDYLYLSVERRSKNPFSGVFRSQAAADRWYNTWGEYWERQGVKLELKIITRKNRKKHE